MIRSMAISGARRMTVSTSVWLRKRGGKVAVIMAALIEAPRLRR
jgi:hypothetical protein